MVVVPQAGHNDLFDRGAWDKVRGFLGAYRPVPVVAKAGRRIEIAAAASNEAR